MSRTKNAVTPAALRYAALVEHIDRTTPWAIKSSTLAAISSVMRGDIGADDVQRMAAVSTTVSEQRTAGAVAVIPLRGVITPRGSFLSMLFGGGSGGLEGFRASFADALDDDDVSAIVIDIDSPGGLVDLVPETAAEIRGARGSKPIVAVANTMAASAAYWIASAADELVVTPSGDVGSVGVYVAHEDWSKFDEDMGVATTLISAGKYKVEGNAFEPLGDEARAHLQETVDEIYEDFVGAVAEGRGVTAAAVKSGFGEGRVVSARKALEEGMVDRVETLDETISRLLTSASSSASTAGATSLATRRAIADPARPAATELPEHDTPEGDPSSAAPPEEREVATAATPSWLLFPTRRHPVTETQEA